MGIFRFSDLNADVNILQRGYLFSMRTGDVVCIVLVTFISLVTRIWLLWKPEQVVFDEVHFGNFTNWYIERSFFFDIHPPLAKLLMAGVAKLSGYPGTIVFGGKKDYFDNETSYVSLRLTPAIFQSFCFPLIYSTMRVMKYKVCTSLTASLVLIFETSLLVEGKFILSDGILHFFSCLAIFCLACFLRYETTSNLIRSGITLGCAMSCKNTAMGLIGLAGISQLLWICKKRPTIKDIFFRALGFLGPIFSVFIAANAIHLVVLCYHGQGSAYLDKQHQETLATNTSYKGKRVLGPSLLERIVYLNYIMHKGNMRITKPHPYQSLPIHWPLLRDKWVLFWSHETGSMVICMGSPLVYWISTVGIAVSTVVMFVHQSDLWFFVVGWACCYWPFILIPWSMFLYHYLLPLIFAVMNLSALIERLSSESLCSSLNTSMVLISLLSYCFLYPLLYGTSGDQSMLIRQWSVATRWREGPPKHVMTGQTSPNTTLLLGTLPL